MTMVYAAVALLGALCLLNLVLTMGIVRRLRDHTDRLVALNGLPEENTLRDPGSGIDPFSAVSATGAVLTRDDLVAPTLVAFFTPDCPACEEKLPAFLSYAHDFPGGKQRVVAVVAGEAGGARYRAALSEVGTVFSEREHGELQKAFGVNAFPAFLVVVDGLVGQSTHHVDDLPIHQQA
ncbi:TlpA disulfide reductase family protein [Actinokineospora sp. 24-640]